MAKKNLKIVVEDDTLLDDSVTPEVPSDEGTLEDADTSVESPTETPESDTGGEEHFASTLEEPMVRAPSDDSIGNTRSTMLAIRGDAEDISSESGLPIAPTYKSGELFYVEEDGKAKSWISGHNGTDAYKWMPLSGSGGGATALNAVYKYGGDASSEDLAKVSHYITSRATADGGTAADTTLTLPKVVVFETADKDMPEDAVRAGHELYIQTRDAGAVIKIPENADGSHAGTFIEIIADGAAGYITSTEDITLEATQRITLVAIHVVNGTLGWFIKEGPIKVNPYEDYIPFTGCAGGETITGPLVFDKTASHSVQFNTTNNKTWTYAAVPGTAGASDFPNSFEMVLKGDKVIYNITQDGKVIFRDTSDVWIKKDLEVDGNAKIGNCNDVEQRVAEAITFKEHAINGDYTISPKALGIRSNTIGNMSVSAGDFANNPCQILAPDAGTNATIQLPDFVSWNTNKDTESFGSDGSLTASADPLHNKAREGTVYTVSNYGYGEIRIIKGTEHANLKVIDINGYHDTYYVPSGMTVQLMPRMNGDARYGWFVVGLMANN